MHLTFYRLSVISGQEHEDDKIGITFKLAVHELPTTHMAPGGQPLPENLITNQELTHNENRPTTFSKTPTSDEHSIHLPVHDVWTMYDIPSMAEVRRVKIRGRPQVGH